MLEYIDTTRKESRLFYSKVNHFVHRLVWLSAARSSLLSTLKGLRPSEHFGGKLGSGGVQKPLSIFLFLFAQYTWTEISFVHMHERWMQWC